MFKVLETSHTDIDIRDSLVLKGIAILMVVFYHYSQTMYAVHSGVLRLGLGVLACSVFFFLSGYALDISFRRMKQFDFKTILQKKVSRLYIPLIICNTICCILLLVNILSPPNFEW